VLRGELQQAFDYHGVLGRIDLDEACGGRLKGSEIRREISGMGSPWGIGVRRLRGRIMAAT